MDDDPLLREVRRLRATLMLIRDLRYRPDRDHNTAPKRLALVQRLAREVLAEAQPCADCGTDVDVGEDVAPQDVVCRGCGHARAHEALYGHEECRDCGQQLGLRDTTRCAQCDGVEDLHEEENEGD